MSSSWQLNTVTLPHADFFCYYTNAQSIRNKFLELQDILISHQPKVIGITESWLTEDVFEDEFYLEDFIRFSCNRMHGGATVYIHASLNPVNVKK